MIVEICVENFEDAKIAERSGCDRIELNSALALGGLTPFSGVLQKCLDNITIPIVVMLRNRPGGFSYSENEFEDLLNELDYLLEFKIEGVVFGILTQEGLIDKERSKIIVEKCHKKSKKAIFSRAFDNAVNPMEAIKDLIEIKVDRLLTSGQRESAIEGNCLIKILVENFSHDIEIVAGSGLNDFNVKQFIAKTGVSSVHSSCKGANIDTTTKTNVDFSYKKPPMMNTYDKLDENKAIRFIQEAKDSILDIENWMLDNAIELKCIILFSYLLISYLLIHFTSRIIFNRLDNI